MAKILIIEDDTSIVELYSKILQEKGHEVLVLRNSNFVPANYYEENVDLILLDVMLPGEKNGFDILEELMIDDKLKKIPVIMLTSIDSEEEVALKIGAKEYLIKTETSNDQLVSLVNKYTQ